MKPKIVFHIGLEKTGTDSFQKFCKENHKLLLRHGVLYPMRNLGFARYNHAALVACYLPYRDFSIGTSGDDRQTVLRSLFKAIADTPAETVLISAEHLSSRFGRQEIAQLASDFAEYDCRIAVVVRDHAARICSAYTQTVMSGRHLTLNEFCDEIFNPGNNYTRYREIIAGWEDAFGKDHVTVLAYTAGENIVESLCAHLVSPALPLSQMRLRKDNRSPDAGTVETMRRLNEALSREGEHFDVSRNFARWAILAFVRAGAQKWLALTKSGSDPVRLDAVDIERLRSIAEDDCRWLEERYHVRLPLPETRTKAGCG